MEDHSVLAPTEYIVRAPTSFISSLRDAAQVAPTPLRNLHKVIIIMIQWNGAVVNSRSPHSTQDFIDVSEELQVFVRVKPTTEDGCLSIADNYVIMNPVRDSAAFKNRTNAGTQVQQKFKFNKIFDQKTTQEQLFNDSVFSMVQDFLLGQNMVTYSRVPIFLYFLV